MQVTGKIDKDCSNKDKDKTALLTSRRSVTLRSSTLAELGIYTGPPAPPVLARICDVERSVLTLLDRSALGPFSCKQKSRIDQKFLISQKSRNNGSGKT
jgi:hypothetical protein